MSEEEIDPNNPVIAQLLRGERPHVPVTDAEGKQIYYEGVSVTAPMDWEVFKIKRKMVENYLKRKKQGKVFYAAKELAEITNEDGKKQKAIKSYGPYRREHAGETGDTKK